MTSPLFRNFSRDDYRELIKLSIIFLGGYTDQKFMIRPQGAMHQARCMAREINSFKYRNSVHSEFLTEIRSSIRHLPVHRDIILKPWLQCILVVKAQYLCVLKAMKTYETIEKNI